MSIRPIIMHSVATPHTDSGHAQQSLVRKKPNSFQFVTFGEPGKMRDPTALSRIRRHAMKDIGLQRRKPKPKKRYVEVSLHVPTRSWAPAPTIGGGQIHTFFHLPFDISDDSIAKTLLASIWDDNPGNTTSRQTAHRADWFFVSLNNAATFNQVLANSELHLEALRSPTRLPRETQVSIHYHQKAVKAIRQQMEREPGKVTELMIGAASGFVVYAEIAGALEWWLPQRKGMVDMLSMQQQPLDPHTIASCSWVELRGAHMQDIQPLLPSPQLWLDAYQLEFDFDRDNPPSFFPHEPQMRSRFSGAWLEILDAVAKLAGRITQRFNSESPKEDDILLWTNVLVHRILGMRSDEHLLEACRLGLLIFLVSVYRRCGSHPSNSRILIQKLQRQLSTKIEWGLLWGVQLWVSCISALESNGHVSFFVKAVVDMKRTLPESSTTGMIDAIKLSGLWIPQLLDEKAKELAAIVDGGL